MKRLLIASLVLIIFPFPSQAQKISGVVFQNVKNPITGLDSNQPAAGTMIYVYKCQGEKDSSALPIKKYQEAYKTCANYSLKFKLSKSAKAEKLAKKLLPSANESFKNMISQSGTPIMVNAQGQYSTDTLSKGDYIVLLVNDNVSPLFLPGLSKIYSNLVGLGIVRLSVANNDVKINHIFY